MAKLNTYKKASMSENQSLVIDANSQKIIDYVKNNRTVLITFYEIKMVLNSSGRTATDTLRNLLTGKFLSPKDTNIDKEIDKSSYLVNPSVIKISPPTPVPSLKRPPKELNLELNLTKLKENAKLIINNQKPALVKDQIYLNAHKMAIAYEDALATYHNKPTLRYIKSTKDFEDNIELWTRIVNIAEQVTQDYDLFVKAQFWVFETWFGKAPKVQEMCHVNTKYPAVEKFNMYLRALAEGQVTSKAKVISRHRRTVKIAQIVKSSQSENQLQQLMKNYSATEEQVFRTFAKGSQAALYFDITWLNQHPTYLRLKSLGEV